MTKEQIFTDVQEIICDYMAVFVEEVTYDANLQEDLGMDSLVRFKKPFASGCPNVRLVREDDFDTGLTTYSAQYKFVGAQIIVR
jgi:hypothetical protein